MINIFRYNYSVNDIKKIEKDIIITFNIWINKWIQQKNSNLLLHSQSYIYDFLNSYIYALSNFDYIIGYINLLRYTSNDKNIRDASAKFDINIKKYFTNFYKNSNNYKMFLILKKIKLDGNDCKINNTKKLIQNILKLFKVNGVHLDSKNKRKFIKINNKLIEFEEKFENNISNDIKTIKFKLSELSGVECNDLKNHKKGNDYIFNTTYPDENIIMRDCSIRNTRKKMYNLFYSVANNNLNILKNIIKLRYDKAIILGYKNTIDHKFKDNRTATFKKVNKLTNQLIPILLEHNQNEINNLLKLSCDNKIYEYDISYYSNIYKKKYINIDNNIIKEYFPSNYSIKMILNIFSNIFNIKIIEIKRSYWDKYVQLYLIKNGERNENKIGYLYLDLYPRDGKFTHAATFDIQNSYYNKDNKRILPVTSILCNYTKPELNKDYSLLTFSEIITFCHEFGHALHYLLSDVKYENLSGISLESDFSEMPSQFFENWCYNFEFLKKISKNVNSGLPLEDSIIMKLIENRYYNIGFEYLNQILLINYDLHIHSKNSKYISNKYLYETWFKINDKLFPKIVKDSNINNIKPMNRFGHLVGYECQYYGYLWSLISAYDAYSLFEKCKSIEDHRKLGIKFRKNILEKGSTLKSFEMLENFLGKKASNKSFIKIFRK